MKIKFVKATLGYKADQEIEIDDVEGKELVTAGKALEVKVSDEELMAKAADALKAEIKEQVRADVKSEVTAQMVKALSKRGAAITVHPDNINNDPQKGFKSVGEFARAVSKASRGEIDERFVKTGQGDVHKATGMSEGTNADGGFAVPTIYSDQLFNDIKAEDDLFGMSTQLPLTNGDILKVVADNTTTLGSGGIFGGFQWVSSDGTTITTAKNVLRQLTLQPHKAAVLVPATEELLDDNNVALDRFINVRAMESIKFGINESMFRGSGSGQPTGFIGHAATINVPRAVVNQIAFADVAKMYARYYGDLSSACWFVSPDGWSQLAQMTSGNYNVFLSGSSINGEPITKMFGIPMITSIHCSGLGSTGDLNLVDTKKYLSCYRGTGIEAAVSMHLYFASQELAFRFTLRVDGRPSRDAVLNPANGTTTLSPFVSLKNATT